MASTSLNISLPIELKAKAQQLAIDKDYGSIGPYIQHLLRRESEKQDERNKLETLLTQGLMSGVSDTDPKTFFKTLRTQIKSK